MHPAVCSISVFRRRFLGGLPAVVGLAALTPFICPFSAAARRSRIFDVKKLGARGDGVTLDTRALQRAIDTCAQNGGGTVRFPPGRYLTGTLFLKSWVTLELESGATLLGSRRLEDYPPTSASVRSYTDNYTDRSLIFGEHLEHITLQGRGIIYGQGGAFRGPYKVRPYLVRLIDCRDVLVRDLTFKDAPMWVQHYLACDGVCLDAITVRSKCNANNDGIDIDGCQRVRIANCDISSGDDAIVLKSTFARPCKQVVITNCVLNSDCNAFKLGTESNGGFEDILLSNCSIYDTRLAGIALEVVDGGVLDRVSISNVTMQNTRGPIFIRLGDRARPFQKGMDRPGIGALRNVSISHIQATGADRTGCIITGLPDHPIQNVSLDNIRIVFPGGGTEEDAQRAIAEKPEAYPEYKMFGILPAYGFHCRHARNLKVHDVEVSVATPDAHPSLFCEDIDGLDLRGWNAQPPEGNSPTVRFTNVRDALIESCAAHRAPGPWLRVSGSNSARIRLLANDLTSAAKPFELDPHVPAGAITSD
jgi:polygalacturonase